jgi:hypothetical protein
MIRDLSTEYETTPYPPFDGIRTNGYEALMAYGMN